MRHLIALGILWLAVFVGAGALCFLAVVLKRMAVLAYWERRLDRGVRRELAKPHMRIVK